MRHLMDIIAYLGRTLKYKRNVSLWRYVPSSKEQLLGLVFALGERGRGGNCIFHMVFCVEGVEHRTLLELVLPSEAQKKLSFNTFLLDPLSYSFYLWVFLFCIYLFILNVKFWLPLLASIDLQWKRSQKFGLWGNAASGGPGRPDPAGVF